jgi:hypothetical protein
VILCERDLEEVLDSQERMLARRNQPAPATPERRRMLKDEYARMLGRVKAMLAGRPGTQLLAIEHRDAISNALAAAGRVNDFLGEDWMWGRWLRRLSRGCIGTACGAKSGLATPAQAASLPHGDELDYLASSNRRCSSITWTPRLRALSSLEPASSPATT